MTMNAAHEDPNNNGRSFGISTRADRDLPPCFDREGKHQVSALAIPPATTLSPERTGKAKAAGWLQSN